MTVAVVAVQKPTISAKAAEHCVLNVHQVRCVAIAEKCALNVSMLSVKHVASAAVVYWYVRIVRVVAKTVK